MRRRDFIQGIAVSSAWPRAARAQQSAMPVVGFLSARSADESASVVTGFRQGLAENGYVEGRNVAIEYRWAEGQYDRLTALAMELLRVPVAVIVAVGGDPAARAAKAATTTIPVVAIFSDDPVASGLVTSLGRPGGNITGISNLSTEMESKRFGLLRAVVPQAAIIGVLLNPAFPSAANKLREMQEAARTLGLEAIRLEIRRAADIAPAFETLKGRAEALYVVGDALVTTHRIRINTLALAARVPTMHVVRELVEAGGLMSYGPNFPDLFRRAADHVDKILRGTKPGEIPVEQPSKFDLVINLTTAKALGLTVPPGVLAIADEVIE